MTSEIDRKQESDPDRDPPPPRPNGSDDDDTPETPLDEQAIPPSDGTNFILTPVPQAKPSEENMTWRNAIQRLRELGIRDFRLQPSGQSDDFHFSCFYAAPDQPRVTRRFEAEDAEPLQAVRKVLAQVESVSKMR